MIEKKNIFLRDVIGKHMISLAQRNDRVVVVNADLSGTCRTREFSSIFPDRSFNVGIAEQNLVSFSAGLAHEGYVPYAFSMASFVTMRACEQCRTDVAYAKLPVRLIGIYSGVSGGISGATHWAIEDCGIMTSIPGITVLEPSDEIQARQLLDISMNDISPMYFRTTIEPVAQVYDTGCLFHIGGSFTVFDGNDGAILCSGIEVKYACEAAYLLKKQYGVSIKVIDMYSIKPIDAEAVVEASTTGHILVAQDHNIFGGLGSLVSMVLASRGISVRFDIAGINDEFTSMAHTPYLHRKYGMDTQGLVSRMLDLVRNV